MTRRPHAATLALAALVMVAPTVSMAPPAAAGPTRPEPPPSRKVLYDPDQATCQPAHVERTFAEQLRPWADQPEPVQARLRLLQAEMLRGSLQRCVSRGLLSAADAQALEQRLLAGPQPSNAQPASPQPSGQRP
jgi:hypothetical protein